MKKDTTKLKKLNHSGYFGNETRLISGGVSHDHGHDGEQPDLRILKTFQNCILPTWDRQHRICYKEVGEGSNSEIEKIMYDIGFFKPGVGPEPKSGSETAESNKKVGRNTAN